LTVPKNKNKYYQGNQRGECFCHTVQVERSNLVNNTPGMIPACLTAESIDQGWLFLGERPFYEYVHKNIVEPY
jgi:hypothetical protein